SAALNYNLYGSESYAGVISGSGNVLISAGSLTLAPSASLSLSTGTLHVGERASATLTLSNSASVSTAQLDLNYPGTSAASAAFRNRWAGTLKVQGRVITGYARMDTGRSDICGQVNQTGGTLSPGGPMPIGFLVPALSTSTPTAGRFSGSSVFFAGNQATEY